MPHATPTLPVDALSLDGMTVRRGAPSSRATCYMHHATCYAHSAGGCPVFRNAGSRVQLQYSRAEDASPTLPVDASSLGGMTARRGAPSSRATCYIHHATPTLQVDAPDFGMTARGVRRQAVQMQHAPSTMHHPLFMWMPCCSVG